MWIKGLLRRKTKREIGFRSKMAELKRVACSTVTDALISATEMAEEIGHVVIIYERTNGDPGGFICNESMDASKMNWLLDQAKHWLWRSINAE